MTEKQQGPSPGVRLIVVSVKILPGDPFKCPYYEGASNRFKEDVRMGTCAENDNNCLYVRCPRLPGVPMFHECSNEDKSNQWTKICTEGGNCEVAVCSEPYYMAA
ncbi:hypothetical protein ACROYT_G031106 [Oculina patagonica]